ncbi:hypothetical protein BKA82DRAFT_1002986 [Pisolithus tinctorius]|uniref:Uncharacterized protein n=1 Tax=Pisolithus tinctorius Marx 270 TaxID=870435 RepID=A0A0C3P257_PISTI|nr:hypothetical protein BKA82DRAFT_1002986 [Pisolithus tinctorius]KIO01576.1 hypothetical protein M404DRAFT_1002986 [Pisolithus tinctorius Marx 270]
MAFWQLSLWSIPFREGLAGQRVRYISRQSLGGSGGWHSHQPEICGWSFFALPPLSGQGTTPVSPHSVRHAYP